MQTTISPGIEARERGDQGSRLHHLGEVIEHTSHLLPAQGPITVFIHHNTLHAFEELPFHEAVKKGAHVFGCQPYLSEDRYRQELTRGRIRFTDLHEGLEQDLGDRAAEPIPCFGTRLDLRLAMLQYPLRTGPTKELVWYVAEANALRRVREEASSAVRGRLIAETRRWVVRDLRGGIVPNPDSSSPGPASRRAPDGLSELLDRFGESTIETWSDEDWEGFTLQALWRVCCGGVRDLPTYTAPPSSSPIRHRDLLLEATGADADAPVHDLLIRFCAAFLDQGLAHWQLPRRDEGFFCAFCALYRRPGGPPDRWMRGLARELGRLEDQDVGPLESILESLEILGVAEGEWEEFLSATLLALRGWGGMVRQVELRGDRAVHPAPAGSLVEFLAVRLILDRFALADRARDALGFEGPLAGLRRACRRRIEARWPPSVEQRAFLVFQLAQLLGLSPDVLHHLGKPQWAVLVEEIEAFPGLERRRIFHLAYEQRFRTQTLDAIALHARQKEGRPPAPEFQVACCIDEREESFRRHLEELAPSVETFGAAGFFSVAMYYRGEADAHFVPLCPVVIRPRHWVAEDVVDELGEAHRRRARTRKALGTASHQFHVGSRTFAVGALLTGAVGVLATFPLVGRILFPRLAARIRGALGRIVRTPPLTRLRLERGDATPGPENGHLGFTVAEMTESGERLLRDIGLTSGFARLVVLLGHGSDSLNNPHNSAYNCGACGGAAGGPNARAMAQILNDPRAREGLAHRGLSLPGETVFVGGYHNTCSDSVTYFDLDRIPESHREEFASARDLIEQACDRNAHERCRRFMSAPLTLSFTAARQHVEERSEDLAQTRPELGHATNAITFVGRREWTRGLFLDRRAFLTSYDPTQDDAEATILTRILQAVFPVCAGINLEYYFSHVDNAGYGAGTKLPHNLAALLGVMDGAASDLRTGLPWQMVEIHEPVRSLFIIETTTEAMRRIMDRNEGIGRICRNGWVQLAVLHPDSGAIRVFQGDGFRLYRPQASVLPRAASSIDWYRGWRDHLEFAEIPR
ncbi:MAG: DUF2309 domain-containing protein [Planctomycetaceae bacterium]|nr:DUF2309 domain-containing protein [Planctomycetaceae bacterium]